MSHCLGVMCAECREVLEPDDCPECGPLRSHGHSFQEPSEYAARTWPDHSCFTRCDVDAHTWEHDHVDKDGFEHQQCTAERCDARRLLVVLNPQIPENLTPTTEKENHQ